MRVIIEIEGQGAGGPEVVLRSAQQTPSGTVSLTGAASISGAIDAGPAPTPPGDGTTPYAQGLVTTPAAPSSIDAASGQSAGAAPSSPSAG